VKIFFPFQQFALKSNYYQIFAKNTPCQIKAIAQFNAMPKSMQCQINAMPNQCNECEAALSNPLDGVRRERLDPVRR
jgi:hypothetical protein